MRGTSIGNVRIYLVANETSDLGSPAWQVGGDQGEAWYQGEVAIPSNYHEHRNKFHVGGCKI